MSSIFRSPKKMGRMFTPETSQPANVTEDATEAGRRKRKTLAMRSGSASTRLSGIQSAVMSSLKKRLGE